MEQGALRAPCSSRFWTRETAPCRLAEPIGPMDLHPRVEELRARFVEVEAALADPGVARDLERLRELGREHSQLAPVVTAAVKWETARRHLDEDREMLRESA